MKGKGNLLSCVLWQIFVLFLPNLLGSNGALTFSKRSADWDEPHTFVKQDGCDRNYLKGFQKIIEGSACKPRPVLVDIISPSSEIQFLPNKVVVNRCDGICHAKLNCIPTAKEKIAVKVQQINFMDKGIQPECGEVHVEEHTNCNCMCTVTKEDCNEKQMYQPGDCNCLCINQDEKRKCLYEGKTWDNEQCSCA
ncbi:vascular endothelial growth factor A-A-like [Hetaerina americana]|uniref:vascular endothelial growth factor A-A-like n=1 Tax=Hetaerina americana TaxID=62018 RepID=UPI003A7F5A9B